MKNLTRDYLLDQLGSNTQSMNSSMFFIPYVLQFLEEKKKKSLKSEAEHPTSKTPEFGIGHGKGDQFISNDKLEQKCHI